MRSVAFYVNERVLSRDQSYGWNRPTVHLADGDVEDGESPAVETVLRMGETPRIQMLCGEVFLLACDARARRKSHKFYQFIHEGEAAPLDLIGPNMRNYRTEHCAGCMRVRAAYFYAKHETAP